MTTGEPRSISWIVRAPGDLGRAIAGVRHRRGWTQQRLAEELGVERSYVSQLESGEATLALERSLRALRRLGAEVSISLPESDAP
jgi:transcriptional regulator with XRE-family HTH domain